MYDMSRVNARGYFDSMSDEERYRLRVQLNEQRTRDYRAGDYARDGGVVDPLPDDAPLFVRQYHDYYKTARGTTAAHPTRTTGSTGPIRSRSSTCRFSPVPARSAAPC